MEQLLSDMLRRFDMRREKLLSIKIVTGVRGPLFYGMLHLVYLDDMLLEFKHGKMRLVCRPVHLSTLLFLMLSCTRAGRAS